LLIGTLLLVTLSILTSRTAPDRDELKFAGLFLAYGSGYSIPSLLLAWIGSFLINRTSRSRRVKRLWIAALAAPLTLLPFYIFEPGQLEFDWQSICYIASLYYLVTVAAIFIYRFPESDAALS